MQHLPRLTDCEPKSVDGKFLVPGILSVFRSFQNKFETVFDEHRTEFRSFSKEQRDKIEHLESRKYRIAQKKKISKKRLIVTTPIWTKGHGHYIRQVGPARW